MSYVQKYYYLNACKRQSVPYPPGAYSLVKMTDEQTSYKYNLVRGAVIELALVEGPVLTQVSKVNYR